MASFGFRLLLQLCVRKLWSPHLCRRPWVAATLCAACAWPAFPEAQAVHPPLVASQFPLSAPVTATAASSALPAASALTREELGDLQMARKHFQAAIESYSNILPRTAQLWNKIGIAYQQMFVVQQARKSYEASLRLDPSNADVINNLATVYYSTQQYGPAEKLYRKALKLRPDSALIYKNLGTDLLAQDKFKKGWDCYQAALALDPEIFEKNNVLRIGEPTPAKKRGAMSYYLAKSYAQMGNTTLAVEYLRRAIDEGFTDRRKIMADRELASLHGITVFEQLIAEQRRQ